MKVAGGHFSSLRSSRFEGKTDCLSLLARISIVDVPRSRSYKRMSCAASEIGKCSQSGSNSVDSAR